MTVSQKGIDFIKGKEGFRPMAYSLKDGRYTIGYGNTFWEDGRRVQWGETITKARAESLFTSILQRFETDLSGLITASLTQSQWDALLSYTYNRGVTSFANSTLRQMVNANPNNPAIAQQFVTEWGSNNTYKAALQERRKQEAELYFSASSPVQDNTMYYAAGILLLFVIIIRRQDEESE